MKLPFAKTREELREEEKELKKKHDDEQAVLNEKRKKDREQWDSQPEEVRSNMKTAAYIFASVMPVSAVMSFFFFLRTLGISAAVSAAGFLILEKCGFKKMAPVPVFSAAAGIICGGAAKLLLRSITI